MLLAVDIGNTQTVLGLYQGAKLLTHWRIATLKSDTADELAVKISALFTMEKRGIECISAIAIASVVPPLTMQWRDMATRFTSKEPLVLSAALDIGLKMDYLEPSEIGADRLADAVAAIELYGAPLLVVDFGTATNIEVIDKHGSFVGGIIAPGLVTSAEALFNAAARLARFDVEVPSKVIGISTKTAVQSGLTYGEVDRIDGLIQRVFDELGYRLKVIATGGLSKQVVNLSRTVDIINDDLTLEGLRIIYERLNG